MVCMLLYDGPCRTSSRGGQTTSPDGNPDAEADDHIGKGCSVSLGTARMPALAPPRVGPTSGAQ